MQNLNKLQDDPDDNDRWGKSFHINCVYNNQLTLGTHLCLMLYIRTADKSLPLVTTP